MVDRRCRLSRWSARMHQLLTRLARQIGDLLLRCHLLGTNWAIAQHVRILFEPILLRRLHGHDLGLLQIA